MNNHVKGFRRDKAILAALGEWGVLDTDQLQMMFFPSLRMTQKRLQRLIEQGKIKRYRDCTGQPYFYYLERKPGQPEHKIGLNWIRLWIERSLKSWEALSTWQYEPNYKSIRPDALAAVRNSVTEKFRFCFIERECDTNPCRKVKLYNDLYASGEYEKAWWAEKADRFPPVIVAVETLTRMDTVKQFIEKENKHGLEFRVYLMDQIKQDVTMTDAKQCLSSS